MNFDLSGHTVLPGIVGVHNHTFYTTSARQSQMNVTSPRLYLASGVTTIRTTGSYSPYSEINMKRAIEEGEIVGPKMHVTGPYITGPGARTYMTQVGTPEDAKRVVAYWAEEGATWFKAYTRISRAELSAAIAPRYVTSADFDDGAANAFTVQSGTFSISFDGPDGQYDVTAPTGGVSASIMSFQGGSSMMQVDATALVLPSSGQLTGTNAYMIFDFVSADQFKWAGILPNVNQARIGQYLSGSNTILATTSVPLSLNQEYALSLTLDGDLDQATITVDGGNALTHTFSQNILDGDLGLGNRKSRTVFDNVVVTAIGSNCTDEPTSIPAIFSNGDPISEPSSFSFNANIGSCAVNGTVSAQSDVNVTQ
mgnify:CR=1 FL=1